MCDMAGRETLNVYRGTRYGIWDSNVKRSTYNVKTKVVREICVR